MLEQAIENESGSSSASSDPMDDPDYYYDDHKFGDEFEEEDEALSTDLGSGTNCSQGNKKFRFNFTLGTH